MEDEDNELDTAAYLSPSVTHYRRSAFYPAEEEDYKATSSYSSVYTQPQIAVYPKTEKQWKIKGGKGYLFVKRSFDIFVSFLMIVLLSPLLLFLLLGVKLSSKGPAIFKDKRVGKNGKTIYVYKFRSMYIDAESRLHEYLTPEQYEEWKRDRKIKNDPRITKFGKFIRKTSLDELPQLFNILNGTMSIVGPRPIAQYELDENYTEEEKRVFLSAKPGLFSNWAVNGRSNVTYEGHKRQDLELSYFEKRSIWFDLKLMFLVIPAVLGHKGAQ